MTCDVTGNLIPANKCASIMNGMPGCPQPLCVPERVAICGKIRCPVGEECCMKCNPMGQIVPAQKCALKNVSNGRAHKVKLVLLRLFLIVNLLRN